MNSKQLTFILTALAVVVCMFNHNEVIAQKTLSKLLKKHNTEAVPYITVEELENGENVLLLDARELKEYQTSHLKDAQYAGYDNFQIGQFIQNIPDKSTKIVVYCSLGIRSEDVAEQFIAAGYTEVYNLYGGIFEWCNNDLPVYNSQNQPTDSIHAFSKQWSKWLKKGIKVYE